MDQERRGALLIADDLLHPPITGPLDGISTGNHICSAQVVHHEHARQSTETSPGHMSQLATCATRVAALRRLLHALPRAAAAFQTNYHTHHTVHLPEQVLPPEDRGVFLVPRWGRYLRQGGSHLGFLLTPSIPLR